MTKTLTVFGTRPEVITMAPVIKELRKHPDEFIYRVCVTAQFLFINKKEKEEG